MKFLFAALMLFVSQAFAGVVPDVIGFNLVSWHSTPGFNNVNPGVYGRWDRPSGAIVAGTYFNSVYKQTYWIGHASEWRSGPYGASLLIGAATGYHSDAMFMFVPSVSYTSGRNTIRLHGIPEAQNTGFGAGLLHISVEHRF
jgi:hypothetical protein